MGKKSKKARKQLVTQHREAEFEKRFDQYLAGEVPADAVTERAKKLKAMKHKPGELRGK